MLIPEFEKKLHFYKGHYVAYRGRESITSRLVYPVPEKNLKGLGIHLTLDMQGKFKFGPDALLVASPSDYSTTYFDSTNRITMYYETIRRYIPSISKDRLYLDYCGIRPKLSKEGFQDFYIEEETKRGFPGFINLVGMESPGLTSCLSIAKEVCDFIKTS